ncbi:MAG: hypothetical protein JKY65_27760 [Planctomycetes bacterium]|nr:hypothetical protein [Planctomycetota bacterium]
MAYENNRQGGFWGCSFGWDSASVEGLNNVYLQFENDQLCFKVQVLDEPKQSELRDLVSRKLLEAAEGSGLRVEKPARFGKGTYMTVARLSTSPLAGGLDWDRLVGRLREARDLVAKTCDLLVASSTAPPTCKKCGGPLEGEGLCPACFAAEA